MQGTIVTTSSNIRSPVSGLWLGPNNLPALKTIEQQKMKTPAISNTIELIMKSYRERANRKGLRPPPPPSREHIATHTFEINWGFRGPPQWYTGYPNKANQSH